MLDIDVKNRQNLTRRSQILLPIATVRQAASFAVILALAGMTVLKMKNVLNATAVSAHKI
jgi:hypothetical protein